MNRQAKSCGKDGRKAPLESQERFPLSHSFNNNKLDDRDHFLQNAKTSVASLRRLITPTRNADHDQPGTLITFIGIRKKLENRDSFGDSLVTMHQNAAKKIVPLSQNRP